MPRRHIELTPEFISQKGLVRPDFSEKFFSEWSQTLPHTILRVLNQGEVDDQEPGAFVLTSAERQLRDMGNTTLNAELHSPKLENKRFVYRLIMKALSQRLTPEAYKSINQAIGYRPDLSTVLNYLHTFVYRGISAYKVKQKGSLSESETTMLQQAKKSNTAVDFIRSLLLEDLSDEVVELILREQNHINALVLLDLLTTPLVGMDGESLVENPSLTEQAVYGLAKINKMEHQLTHFRQLIQENLGVVVKGIMITPAWIERQMWWLEELKSPILKVLLAKGSDEETMADNMMGYLEQIIQQDAFYHQVSRQLQATEAL